MVVIKKYLQISLFLIVFGVLILIKNYTAASSDTETAHVVGNTKSPSPTSSAISLATPSETQTAIAPTAQPTARAQTNFNLYKDGVFTGSTEDAYYGNIQVQAVITGGKLVNVVFLQYPNDNRTSRSINEQAVPLLKGEAIAAQSGSVDIVSGASDSSLAFRKSINTALSAARQ